MHTLKELVATILAKRTVTDTDIAYLSDCVYAGHQPNIDDIRLLTELYTGLATPSAKFTQFYFGTLKKTILADGEIQPSEQFYLLKMLYSDREVRTEELTFLRELKREARVVSPEFDALCAEAFQVKGKSWDVGGTPSASLNPANLV
jgi:hypothetical protein